MDSSLSKKCICIYWIGLIGFGIYGISTIVGYLIPNLLFTYIYQLYDLYIYFVDTHC